MRDWLKEHAPPVPSTDADVIGKFLRCIIISNAEWDGVPLQVTLPRPHLAGPMPWSNLELPGPAREITVPDEFEYQLMMFFLRSFALGVGLTLAIAAGVIAIRHYLPSFSFGHSSAHEESSGRQSGVAPAQ